MTATAAGYVRVSTEVQAQDGYGLHAQVDAIKAYCESQGWELVETYTDAGRSGKSIGGREGVARALDDAEARRFQYLVFWKLDRLARNLRELLVICDRLEAAGVGIISINEHIDMNTSAGRMMRNMMGSVAEFEREVTVERIEAGLAAKARKGELLGPLPLGYRRDETGAVVVDEAIAALIREAYAMYASGSESLRDLAQWAGRSGLRSAKGKPLDRMSIRKLLTNPTYAGKVAFHARRGGGVVSQGTHPAIVEPDLFEAVQQRLRGRRYKRPERPYGREAYSLSVVATCGSCHAGLCGAASVKEGRYRYRYYRCSTAHRRGRAACRQPMIQASVFEDQIAGYVGGMRLPPAYVREVIEELRARHRSRIKPAEIAQAQRARDRWYQLYAEGEIDKPRLMRELQPLKGVLAAAEQPGPEFDLEEAADYLRRIGELWLGSSRTLQREFVREVFQGIVVQGRDITEITPKSAYAPLFVLDRRERFDDNGSNSCRMAPRAGLEPTT